MTNRKTRALMALGVVVALLVLVPMMDFEMQEAVVQLGLLVFGCGLLVWCISAGIKRAQPTMDHGGGRGKFQIAGVDKATGMDTTDYVIADSPENARVKAELNGIIVTSVTREK